MHMKLFTNKKYETDLLRITSQFEDVKPYYFNYELKFKVCPTEYSNLNLTTKEFTKYVSQILGYKFVKEQINTIQSESLKFDNDNGIISLTYDHTYTECVLNHDTPIGLWFNMKYLGNNDNIKVFQKTENMDFMKKVSELEFLKNKFFNIRK